MNKENTVKRDFPFYNDKTKISDIIILAIMPIFFTIYTFIPFKFLGSTGAYIFCISQLIAFLIVARGKISLLISNPKFKDYVRIVITLILQLIFAIVVAMLLNYVFNIKTTGNSILESDMGVGFWITIIVQLFGEELYKVLIFLVVLIIMNKITKKRNLSIAVATIVALLMFAIIHMTTYNNLIQILLLQGLATIFNFYNYLKTKNILTSYLQHLLFDAVPFILAMIHII